VEKGVPAEVIIYNSNGLKIHVISNRLDAIRSQPGARPSDKTTDSSSEIDLGAMDLVPGHYYYTIASGEVVIRGRFVVVE
jgi:hypothetical protein